MEHRTKEHAIAELERLIDEVPRLGELPNGSADHVRWRKKVIALLIEGFGQESHHYKDFASINWHPNFGMMVEPDTWDRFGSIENAAAYRRQQMFRETLESARGLLLAAIDDLRESEKYPLTTARVRRASKWSRVWKEFKSLPAPQLWVIVALIVLIILLVSGKASFDLFFQMLKSFVNKQ